MSGSPHQQSFHRTVTKGTRAEYDLLNYLSICRHGVAPPLPPGMSRGIPGFHASSWNLLCGTRTPGGVA